MAFRQGNGRPGGRSNGGGFNDRGPRGGSGSYGGGRPQMELFDVTCAQCGKHTQVPFKPTGERPVLCRECFQGGGDRDGPRRDGPRESRQQGGGNQSAELAEINAKLDKIMEALDIE